MVSVRYSLFASGAVVLALAAFSWSVVRGADPKPPETAKPAPGAVEVRFADGTKQKMTLLDQKIDFTTPYGKISVPAVDVLTLNLAMRIPEEDAKEIARAIANLGNSDFKEREAASEKLLRWGARAYPAVLEASKSSDVEVKQRAEGILEKIKKGMPADMLKVRKHDVLTAGGSTFTGRIESVTLRASTAEAKEKEVKVADILGLRSLAVKEVQALAVNVQADPGSPYNLGGQVGTVYYFRVTGANAGSLWGTDVYTNDSIIAKAAVHAGVLKVGETGVVKVTLVQALAAYEGSTRNEVSSSAYGPWPGAYTVEKVETDK